MPAGVCPERWCLDHPHVIEEVHRAYKGAGSEMVYTCTFGAHRLKLAEFGETDVRGINAGLARLARRAVGRQVFVLGDMGPTGHFVEPFGEVPFEQAVAVFREQAEGLLEGGVDGFVIETMMDIQEARAALLAVKELGDYFTLVTMTYEQEGRTLNGTAPVAALITLQSLGADAVGCNCSAGPDGMMDWIAAMKPYATVPLVAKPNAGLPKLLDGRTVFDMDADAFGAFGQPFAEIGLNLLGGCCGTTPAHIAAIVKNLGDTKPVPPWRLSLSAVSSARSYRVFDRHDPLVVIGERINPTGKKALQQELLEGKTALVRQMAKEQQGQGADLLDVNVGVPGIDETEAIRNVIRVLVETTPLPLTLDSPKIETLEAALRLYPGKALINSISGEREKLERLLPLAAKYGAMFILLPLVDGDIPETAADRRKVIRKVVGEAEKYGYTKEDLVVDGLVMTVASNPAAAAETLRTVDWCHRVLGCRTVLGVSNVSFGLPERKWINAAFLNMAQGAGLTMAILNPAPAELMSPDGRRCPAGEGSGRGPVYRLVCLSVGQGDR
jgi:5-methyltetrahydrofolate--homocysteine methyltransferase